MPTRTRKPSAQALPAFIPPMLAKRGNAFDSDEHLYEIKWDGTRTLAFIENKHCRLLNLRHIDMTERYPEFKCLAGFPAGTVLDGKTSAACEIPCLCLAFDPLFNANALFAWMFSA